MYFGLHPIDWNTSLSMHIAKSSAAKHAPSDFRTWHRIIERTRASVLRDGKTAINMGCRSSFIFFWVTSDFFNNFVLARQKSRVKKVDYRTVERTKSEASVTLKKQGSEVAQSKRQFGLSAKQKKNSAPVYLPYQVDYLARLNCGEVESYFATLGQCVSEFLEFHGACPSEECSLSPRAKQR